MTTNQHHIFLEKLRREMWKSGKINMTGAIPELVKEFRCSYDEASAILFEWMATYRQSDYAGMFDNNNQAETA